MTEPTKEMIALWRREWLRSHATDSYAEVVARRAAAWAREQALEEAERVVRQRGAPRSADAIRALKDKSRPPETPAA